MSENVKSIHGTIGEDSAAAHLTEFGYNVIARNFRVALPKIRSRTGRIARGEVDIIALDGEYIVFVEVKARQISQTDRYGRPGRAVNSAKMEHLRLSASEFLREHPELLHLKQRIDVIEVYLHGDVVTKILHLPTVYRK